MARLYKNDKVILRDTKEFIAESNNPVCTKYPSVFGIITFIPDNYDINVHEYIVSVTWYNADSKIIGHNSYIPSQLQPLFNEENFIRYINEDSHDTQL